MPCRRISMHKYYFLHLRCKAAYQHFSGLIAILLWLRRRRSLDRHVRFSTLAFTHHFDAHTDCLFFCAQRSALGFARGTLLRLFRNNPRDVLKPSNGNELGNLMPPAFVWPNVHAFPTIHILIAPCSFTDMDHAITLFTS
jgi:hypothetical protein